jgi:hypothetical protein
MAGDWIKMRLDLPEDPAVIEMADITGLEEQCIVGYLHAVWSWASRHCNDGTVTGVTLNSFKRVTRCNDVVDAMVKVGWLLVSDVDGRPVLEFPNWDRHNSQSAKQRALTTARVRKSRTNNCNGTSVTKALPEKRREEKRREENKKEYTRQFEEWYLTYPKRCAKAAAAAAYAKAIKAIEPKTLLDITKQFAASDKGNGEYCPNPATWLNQGRWDDDPASWQDRKQQTKQRTLKASEL